MQETVLILDFGSQYTQLIARRIRELNVYSEIHPWNKVPEIGPNIKGVILSGSPFSVRDEKAPVPDLSAIRGQLPLLGVCFGAQFLAHSSGGTVEASEHREYGRAHLAKVEGDSPLFKGVNQGSQVWMSHGDTITSLPSNFNVVCSTDDVKYAGYAIENESTWAIQFHPEVVAARLATYT